MVLRKKSAFKHVIADIAHAVVDAQDAGRGMALNIQHGLAFCIYCNKSIRMARGNNLFQHLRETQHRELFQLATGKPGETRKVRSINVSATHLLIT